MSARARVGFVAALCTWGSALAACGWLLPDGVLETTESDAAALEEDSGSASDSGVPMRFGSPTEVLSSNIPSAIVARYAPKTRRLYYSVAPYFVPTIFAVVEDGGREPITGPDGGFIGDAPSFTSINFMYYVGPAEDGGASTLKFRVDLDGGARWSAAGDISSASAVEKPYVLPNGSALYYASPSGIVRATLNVLTLKSEKLVTFKLRDPSAAFSGVNHPVVTPNETTIYFAVPDQSSVGIAHVWTARRGTDNPADATFVDAHPLEIEGSSGSELPSWVNDDGNELLFSRAPGLNGAVVSVLSITR